MATTEELVKKAFDEIGDQISGSTRELLNSIPKLERRVAELERERELSLSEANVEPESPRKADIPEKEPVPGVEDPADSAKDRDDKPEDDGKDAVYADKVRKSQGKNARPENTDE